jgi:hypothetical protein
MSQKKPRAEKKRRTVGIEAIVEPGVGALYVRGPWMKKLSDIDKRRRDLRKKR